MIIAGPVTLLSTQDVVTVTDADLAALKRAAGEALLRRARICLHRSQDDAVQEMLIAFHRDSYVPPHRHPEKSESFHILDGEVLVVLFNEAGSPIRTIHMGCGRSDLIAFCRLNKEIWHTVVVLSDFAVIHEVTSGPFRKDLGATAPWAPHEHDPTQVQRFLTEARKLARTK